MTRKIELDNQGRFEYSSVVRDPSDRACNYNFILGAAIFYHRFYHYVSKVKDTYKSRCNNEYLCSNTRTFSLQKSVPR